MELADDSVIPALFPPEVAFVLPMLPPDMPELVVFWAISLPEAIPFGPAGGDTPAALNRIRAIRSNDFNRARFFSVISISLLVRNTWYQEVLTSRYSSFFTLSIS